jgi:hypothetical protein
MWEGISQTIARWPGAFFLARLAFFVAQDRPARSVEVNGAKLLYTDEQRPRPARLPGLGSSFALPAPAVMLAKDGRALL